MAAQEVQVREAQVAQTADSSQFGRLAVSALVFIALGGLTLLAAMVTGIVLTRQGYIPLTVSEAFSYYALPLMLIFTAVLFSGFGYLLLRSVGIANKQVIPPQDRDLVTNMIKEDNTTGIETYVRLSSLSGVAGFFQKIGVSGLPLATIFLSLAFALMALAPLEQQQAFADLAKLTLGAFLGSFVQRAGERGPEPVTPGTGGDGTEPRRDDPRRPPNDAGNRSGGGDPQPR